MALTQEQLYYIIVTHKVASVEEIEFPDQNLFLRVTYKMHDGLTYTDTVGRKGDTRESHFPSGRRVV